MTQRLNAVFDGKVFRPDGTVKCPANSEVELTIHTVKRRKSGKPYSLLRTVAAMKLKGPKDFSTNLDDYLYRGKPLK